MSVRKIAIAVVALLSLSACGGDTESTAGADDSTGPVPTESPSTTTTTVAPTTTTRPPECEGDERERRNQKGDGSYDQYVCVDGTFVFKRTVLPTTTTSLPPLTREACLETPPEGVFAKDSGAYVGRCLHFWAYVFQFDANTGPCSFLGRYGSGAYNDWYDFGEAIVRVDGERDGGALPPGVPRGTCDLLTPIVADDLVEVWAVAESVDSYSTTGGGSNTYTVFKIVDIVKYGSS